MGRRDRGDVAERGAGAMCMVPGENNGESVEDVDE
jgi:hypothetical protein